MTQLIAKMRMRMTQDTARERVVGVYTENQDPNFERSVIVHNFPGAGRLLDLRAPDSRTWRMLMGSWLIAILSAYPLGRSESIRPLAKEAYLKEPGLSK